MNIRYFHKHSHCLYPVKTRSTPELNVYEQAEQLGGSFSRITKGLDPNICFNFNPTLHKDGDKTWIAWRAQPEPFCFRWDNQYFYLNNRPTTIQIGQLADDETVIGAKNARKNPHRCSYEDPRLFEDTSGGLYLQFVASTYASTYAKNGKHLFDNSKVIVGRLDEYADIVDTIVPNLENNRIKAACEKNWCFFTHNNELHILYSIYPMRILRESGETIEVDSSLLRVATKDSPTFCSTAPVDIGDEYLVFYHWKNGARDPNGTVYLKYYTSAFTLDKETFKINRLCEKPLLYGSLADQLIWWTDLYGNPVSRQPATILPFGCLVENNEVVLSVGVNDAFMGIMRLPLDNVLNKMTNIVS